MGAAAGSTPAAIATPIIFFGLVLFLGYLKLKFSSDEQAFSNVGKEKGGFMNLKKNLRLVIGGLFDTLHGLGMAGLTVSAVP